MLNREVVLNDPPYLTLDLLMGERGEAARHEIVAYVLKVATRMAARLSSDPLDREAIVQDVLQTTFTKFVRKLKGAPEEFSDLGQVKAYLRAVLRASVLPKKQVRVSERSAARDDVETWEFKYLFTPENQEAMERMRQAAESELTEIERQVLAARSWERMSIKDIAAMLNITPGEVSRAALSGMEKLERSRGRKERVGAASRAKREV